jgi:hypothetical protein
MRVVTRSRTAAAAVCAAVVVAVTGAGSAETLVERGAYLVTTIAACGNCHTPRDASGKPMTNMTLAGGFEFDDGPIGHVVVRNITPDPETGIGKWAFNANTNPNVNSPHYLQASLAINGQGAKIQYSSSAQDHFLRRAPRERWWAAVQYAVLTSPPAHPDRCVPPRLPRRFRMGSTTTCSEATGLLGLCWIKIPTVRPTIPCSNWLHRPRWAGRRPITPSINPLWPVRFRRRSPGQ